jgi:hypothetical protein
MGRGANPRGAHVGTGSTDVRRDRNGGVWGLATAYKWRDRPAVLSTRRVPAAGEVFSPEELEARIRLYAARVAKRLPVCGRPRAVEAEPLMWCAWCLRRTARKFCCRQCRYAAEVSRAATRAVRVAEARDSSRTNAKNHRVECRHCGRESFGRPDKIYCGRWCKTQAQNVRRRKGA